MRFYFSACLFGLGLFLAFPQLDLAFSGLFYRPESGFTHQDLPWVQALYWWFARLQFPILIALVVGLLAAYLRSPWARHRAGLWFLLLALFLGPGLVVNELLKKHWGRARPVQVTEFGGQAQYTPPWQITDQCPRNCSFSSGHAALGFYPMALGWVWWRRRKIWWLAGGLCGTVVGLGRILQGGHFLSDVLMSAAVVWGVCALLARLLLPPPTALTNPSSPP
jgi:lipid A 4'-phosphatase